MHDDEAGRRQIWSDADPVPVGLDMTPLQRLVWGVCGAAVMVLCLAVGYAIDEPYGSDADVHAMLERAADALAQPARLTRTAVAKAECTR